jgi:Fe-S-cluster containining protein
VRESRGLEVVERATRWVATTGAATTMITDLVQIRRLGEKKRGENERLRKHMKSRDHSDRILRRVAQGIEDQIDCTTCANCCRVATARVSERDVEHLARFLRIARADFLRDYTEQSEEEGTILRRSQETGCVFLDGNTCTVYEARPETCEKFPHVVRGTGSIASRMWQFVDRACYCPIVYNTLEAFKKELGFKR